MNHKRLTDSALIYSFTTPKWQIVIHAEEELENPADHFATGDDALDAEICDKINRGDYLWFTACCTVTHRPTGLPLGTDYLGCCCYESLSAFRKRSGYMASMVQSAISEARKNIKAIKGDSK